MADREHHTIGNDVIHSHGILWQTVANNAALLALTIVSEDVTQRKVILQSDTGQLWVPTATTPTFVLLGLSLGVTGDMATALGTAAAGASGKALDAASVLPAKTAIDFDFQNHDAKNVKTGFLNGEIADGNSGAAFTVNWTLGLSHKLTLTANCTLSFTAPAGPTWLQIKLIQDGTGSRTVTWPSMKWAGGAAPTLTTTATTGTDIISIWYDGAAYWGTASLGFA